jgi:hypothetical protein
LNSHNDKALDIYQNIEFEGQNLIFSDKHDGINQKWRVIYTDKAPTLPPKTGEFVPEWGFKNNKDFHIISALPSRRYLSVIDNYQIVIKTSNGSNGQKWFFNYAQRSITSRQNNQVMAD